MNPGINSTSAEARVRASDVAEALRTSIEEDHETRTIDPQSWEDLLLLARWARPWAYFESEMKGIGVNDPRQRFPVEEVADWLRSEVSPHPERFAEIVKECRTLEAWFLRAQVTRLESCGTPWRSRQFVLRIYWKDRHGRERLRRQVGIHRCKHAECPTCGRSRQAHLTADLEKVLILARDWGFHEGHGRLVTLTVPNGSDLNFLRDQAHTAFAKLQRTRWWKHHVFGWVRGSEIVTGNDGNWNLHIHLLVIFWSSKVSYQLFSKIWTQELGGTRENGRNYVVDFDSLETKRWIRKDGREGHLDRRGGLIRAARYITKYLTKAEDLWKLQRGPGGLAHLIGSTKGLRRFSVGGGCAVLRRAARVLIPSRTFQAEEALAGTYLHEGRPPWRVEEVNPLTGEAHDVPPERLQDERQGALARWGEVLETNPVPTRGQAFPGRVAGVPCGPRGRYRRLGAMPLAGPGPTVEAFERKGVAAIHGARSLLGGWKVYRWQEQSQKSGKTLKFAAVLPSKRYSWRRVKEAIQSALAHGSDGWTTLRRAADREASAILLDPLASLDAHRALMANLPKVEEQSRADMKNACELAKERIQDLAYEHWADGNTNEHLENLLHLVRHPNALWNTLALTQHPLALVSETTTLQERWPEE